MRKTEIKEIYNSLNKFVLPNEPIVNIHSSLLRFGKIEGGLTKLMECIEDWLGVDATILMPAYTYADFSENRIWYSNETKSQMGAFTEFFRKKSDVRRTLHPFHSICVKGKYENEFLECRNLSSWDKDSPFAKLIEYNAYNLMLGAEFIGGATFYHHTEEVCNVPYRKYKDFPGEVYDQNNKLVNKTFKMFVRIITKEYEYNSVRKEVFNDMSDCFDVQKINGVKIYFCNIPKTHNEFMKRIKKDPYYGAECIEKDRMI